MRDYYLPTRRGQLVTLADYVGEAESTAVAYRVGDRIVKANNDLVGAITGLPAQFRDNWALITDPRQRRSLARALVDNNYLTERRRRAIFSILLWGTLLVWLTVGFVVAAVNSDAYSGYQSGWALFFYSIGTSIFLPTPFEVLLQSAANAIGIVWTVLIASFAKTAGAWLVLMMGDKANEGMNAMLDRHALLRRGFHAMERFARKYGLFALFLFFVPPFSPDTAPLFIFALLGMKKGPFLLVTLLAFATRSIVYLLVFGDGSAAFF